MVLDTADWARQDIGFKCNGPVAMMGIFLQPIKEPMGNCGVLMQEEQGVDISVSSQLGNEAVTSIHFSQPFFTSSI